ncbi:MAG: CCA tRNA nucleotidyltransferase [Clostridiales bacterium]|nr:CCA tRNA nucleotidyltransferase [Clostridiales bacterium]
MRIQMPAQVEQIIGKLNENGYEAFAVGGCVRDSLLGREPEDWDITTSARPEQVKALFRRTVDTGIQHGTVTVMIGRIGYEVTTYRIDGEYEDGRHPKQVVFTSNLLEDLRRRDFTINAMAYSYETGMVDAFGGVQDLEKKVIRCVGDPLERFTEDALRILRAIRFCAQLGFAVEAGTREAIPVIAPNLAKVSRERIQAELTKILLSDHPEQIKAVYATGISRYISPAFAALPWERVSVPATLPREKYVRWAAFLRGNEGKGDAEDCGRQARSETAVRVLRDLKMDNDTIARVKLLVAWSGVEPAAESEAVRRAMAQMEPELWDALSDLNGYGEEIRALTARIRADGDCLWLKDLAVKGRDLIEAGIKPGKEIGEILSRMLDHVLSHPEDNQREILLRIK